ncbi:hypothetical protein [Mucilaginibacter aquatilis]|uniref:Uncharacterized protein n=1 Tax=Mucilaginibacter aquatilis TaxID=1517760 RepID=A0A6I4IRK7_9SPHI|nr:hypothetical protein [Mucilaginibacter aquatilis]MVN93034.1 hypothetical protein [Mucilaginibacter aquatilis]
MDSLNELVKLLDETDFKQFKWYLQRKNKRNDVKNLDLLNIIRADDIDSLNKLYNPDKNKDAYHALRKRLQDNLVIFLSGKTFESSHSESQSALRLLVVARYLLENDLVKLAFKCLEKAEASAERAEQFNLLNEILLLKLQYAHLPQAASFDVITARFTQNQLYMQREANLNVAYAYLRQQLQFIHQEGRVVNLTSLVIATIRRYKISMADLMTHKSVYQILFIANEYAAIQQNYQLIERFVNRVSRFIELRSAENKSHTYYHIHVLYYLANFHLRQKNFAKSMHHLSEMMELMQGGKYYHVFYMRYELLYALNKFFSGFADAAINVLQAALSGKKHSAKLEDIEDLRICLAMFLALNDNRASLKYVSMLNQTDAWYEKKMGMLWSIRKHLMEVLIYAQFSNIELATSRLQSFRRRYKSYLLKTSEQRVLNYLKLVERYLVNPNVIDDERYKHSVLAMANAQENNDIFTLSFIGWLIARWEKDNAYKTVLNLIQK